MEVKDLTNAKFGRLSPKKRIAGVGRTKWTCICDCGTEVTVRENTLLTGHVKSCGCLHRETSAENLKKS